MAGVTRAQAERALACVREQFKEYIAAGDPPPRLVENWVPVTYREGRVVEGETIPFAIMWEEGPSEWAYRAPEGGRDIELTLELRSIPGVDPVAVVDTPAAVGWPEGVQGSAYFSYVLGLYED